MRKLKYAIVAIAMTMAGVVPALADGEVKSISGSEFVKEIFDYRTDSLPKSTMPLPAVVDFWAPWCGPCLKLSPTIDELAREYAGKVNFYKLNIDDNQQLARDLGISSIPLVVFFPNNGTPMRGAMGLQPKEMLEQAINDYLLTPAGK